MGKIFYPTSEKLSYLLESIHNREIALPDFQRDFVWDPNETEQLVESLCQNFPAGSLLRIKNSKGFYFVPRAFEGAPVLGGHAPSYLILDGQQRLTSLYQALYGKGSHRYFIEIARLIRGDEIEDAVFYLRENQAKKRLGTIAQQAESLTFPLELLFGSEGGFEDWLDRVLEARTEEELARKDLKSRVREVRRRFIQPVEAYEFPMVSLADDTTAAAVCTIFETLNRTGVKLSVFDLLAARFWHGDVKLRDLWDQARVDHSIIADFDVDPYYVLQAVALFAAKNAPSCKRGDILELTLAQVREGWKPVVAGMAETLRILREDCGVILPQWLPYNTILIPAAAVLATAGDAKGPEIGAIKQKFKRWFWCSVFAQTYERAPNSQAIKDYGELVAWFRGGPPPQSVAQFRFDAEALSQITPRQRAAYRGFIALVLRHGALDFHKDERITASLIRDRKIDDHHVFPQGYLSTARSDVPQQQRDCILNRTLIDKQTNILLGKKPPSEYLAEIEKTVGSEALGRILTSHLLPSTSDSPLRADDFDQFLFARRQLLERELRAVTE